MIPILLALAATQPATAPAELSGNSGWLPPPGPVLIRYDWASGITVATDHGGTVPFVGDELMVDGLLWRVSKVRRYSDGGSIWQIVAQIEPAEHWKWRTDK